MNDVRTLEMLPVNLRRKQQRGRILLLDTPLQVTIQREVKLLAAVSTRGFDLDRKFLVT